MRNSVVIKLLFKFSRESDQSIIFAREHIP